jgi:thioredoxin 1
MGLPEVTDSSFQAEVVESATPTLVDFWAPWCGPCRMVSPVLEQIDADRADVRVVKLNIDDNQQTAAKFGVMSIPTMILFKNGEAVQQIVGAQPRPRIESALDSALA